MIPTERIAGDCPCCGQSIRDIEYFFHRPTGVVISRGNVLVLSPTHSSIFEMLRRAHPHPVSINDIHREINRGRADGGIGKRTLAVTICHMRPLMELLGFVIPVAYGAGGYYSLQINEQHTCKEAA